MVRNSINRFLYVLLLVGSTLSSKGLLAQSQPGITCKCKWVDKWQPRLDGDTIRNRLLLKACESIQNQELEPAIENLRKALELADDIYFSGQLENLESCLAEQKRINQESTTAANVNQVQKTASNASESVAVRSELIPEKAEEAEADSDTKELSAEETKFFQEKGKAKVMELEQFIKVIADKKTSSADAQMAINNALQLFDSENHFVQVSSINRPEKPKFPVRRYLNKLHDLKYDQITIGWADFQYAPKFRLAPDGIYYGFIQFRQRFTATLDGVVVYEDITDKVVGIALKPLQRNLEGSSQVILEVFLGDISVVQTGRR